MAGSPVSNGHPQVNVHLSQEPMDVKRRYLGQAPTPVDRGVTTRPVVAVTNGFVVSFTCRFSKREGSCPTAVNLWLSVSCVFRCVVRLKSERVFIVVFGIFTNDDVIV